jgi:hypothetical protein
VQFADMNALGLALLPKPHRPQYTEVSIHLDGIPLVDQLRRPEPRQSENYFRWNRARSLLTPGRHLLGTPRFPRYEGFSEILVCTCGETFCMALVVKAQVWPRHVGWLAWRIGSQGHTSPCDEPRPMLFGRSQYEAEVARVSEQYDRVRPDG